MQLFLQLLFMLYFLFQELLLQVGVPYDIFLAEFINFKVGIFHLETTINHCLKCFDLFRHLLIHDFFNFPLSSFSNISILKFFSKFIVELKMHKIAMHMLFEHFGINQVLTTKLVNFLLTNEFELIINHFCMLLLKFFSNIVYVRHPFRSWA